MIYKKPDNISYTDMCIHIDTTMYSDSRDDDTIFQYLYHILKMLAIQNSLCYTDREYDDFAIFSASKIFTRMSSRETPVKSVLNYCKSTIHYLRVDFEYFEGRVLPDSRSPEVQAEYDFDNILSKRLESLEVAEFRMLLDDIPSMVKFHMKNLPFVKGTNEYMNVYLSIVLTLINRLTFSRKGRARFEHLQQQDKVRTKELTQLYQRERYDDAVVFHLPESMEAFIDVVSRQVLHILAQELSSALHTRVSSDIESLTVAAADYNRSLNYVDKN